MGDNLWLRFATVGSAAFLTGAASTYFALNHMKPQPVFHPVGTLSNILIYPVKSCRPISVPQAECTFLGPKHEQVRDRSFILTDSKYHFITARKESRLVLVQPSFKDGKLLLDAPDMDTLEMNIPDCQGQTRVCTVWGEKVNAIDCGREVGEWFEQFLGRKDQSVRLVYNPWQDGGKRIYAHWKNWDRFKKHDKTTLADDTSYMMLGEGSVTDLNSRLEKAVTHLYFRPNFTVQGTHPYEEDSWKYVKIGSNCSFRGIRPCTRCIFTTIDPETGIRAPAEPLKTLKSYRRVPDPQVRKAEGDSPIFGRHLGIDCGGIVRVGDTVSASF